jgi:hypothetical protein
MQINWEVQTSGKAASFLKAHFREGSDIDYRYRMFHIEIMRGGMNRLLLRSNRNDQMPSRVEILFMNVKFMKIGVQFDGLVVRDCGQFVDDPGSLSWSLEPQPELHFYEVESSSGTGILVAGSVAVDESDAGASDPSRFFMMDPDQEPES